MKAEAREPRLVRILVELVWLVPLSAALGFVVGLVQHFVGFGVWGYGFARSALSLAVLEGGFLGAVLGVPTGVVAYYAGLRREATLRRVGLVASATLAAGCLLGAALFWVSAFATPIAAVALAYWVAYRTPEHPRAPGADAGRQ